MKWLFLTTACHPHARNIARALFEHDALHAWLAGMVFSPALAERCGGSDLLKRRVIREVPFSVVRPNRGWEFLRLAAHRLRLGRTVEDDIWEKGEFALDARGVESVLGHPTGVVGFEHGCLESLIAARERGLPGVLNFASAHHLARRAWVDAEYEREPEWSDSSEQELSRRAEVRDQRRDREARAAELVVANSEFTRNSLVQGGVPADKVVTVPLGFPPVHEGRGDRDRREDGPLRLLFVGAVALHKGFHCLQRAFLALNSPHVCLDVYGSVRVNRGALADNEKIRFHGMVSQDRLARAYAEADVLVFPSLCDGYGLAAAEAFSWGVPVICSENAGVVQFVKDGWNGFRVPPSDVSALKDVLKRCLDERARVAGMRDAAFQTAKEWTWGHFREAWYRALKEACLAG
jgi:glycosyltransferase involved in cell wall biosynthesis